MTLEERLDDEFIAALNRVRAVRAGWDHGAMAMVPVLEKLEAIGATVSVPYYIGDYIHVSLTGDTHAIADAVRILRTAGWKSSADKPTRNSPSWSAFFTHENMIGMKIYFSFASNVCKRVKIGTKTETVDVYEVQCGASEIYWTELAGKPTTEDDIPF